jgi:hypothetical protein
MSKATRGRYLHLRHFSKMSLANTTTLQHVLICDVAAVPLLWLTSVPLCTPSVVIYELVALLVDGLPQHLHLLACGLPLQKQLTLAEHRWQGRQRTTPGGTSVKGWRLDLYIVVTSMVAMCDAERQRLTIVPMDLRAALENADVRREKCQRTLSPVRNEVSEAETSEYP